MLTFVVMINNEQIDFAPLGMEWWVATGRVIDAEPHHIAFAVCVSSGEMTLKRAAKLAGYASHTDAMAAHSGHSAARTTKVKLLLMAAHEEKLRRGLTAGRRPPMPRAEWRRWLQELEASTNPSATAFANFFLNGVAEKPRTGLEVNDQFSDARTVRSFLGLPGGSVGIVALMSHMAVPLEDLPLLRDVVARLQVEDPGYYDLQRTRAGRDGRLLLDRRLADPDWQRDEREAVWREIGLSIPEVESRTRNMIPNTETQRISA